MRIEWSLLISNELNKRIFCTWKIVQMTFDYCQDNLIVSLREFYKATICKTNRQPSHFFEILKTFVLVHDSIDDNFSFARQNHHNSYFLITYPIHIVIFVIHFRIHFVHILFEQLLHFDGYDSSSYSSWLTEIDNRWFMCGFFFY
jgi:hypothetical protein